MKKLTLWTTAILMSFTLGGAVVTTGFTDTPAAADCSTNGKFLGFTPWYHNLQVSSSDCTIKNPGDNLSGFIWTIVLNLLDDLLRIVGYVSVIFIIWGGFKYMTSTGSPDGMTKAKSTIMNAIIGLAISVGSIAIINLAVGAFQ